ncbi:MAG: penicillin-binding transpeptidase domain-containing protein, partial [Acidimicrobiales bacterium]
AAAERFLEGWAGDEVATMRDSLADPPATFPDDFAALVDGLRIAADVFEVGDVEVDGDTGTVRFDAMLTLAGLGDWSYEGRLDLTRRDDQWLVAWSPAALHPSLQPGRRLVASRERLPRAAILGVGRQPLVTDRAAVTIGIEPRRATDIEQVKLVLNEQLGVDPLIVDRELRRPGVQPDHFVPIVTVRRERYDQVRPVVRPVPGLLFRETTARLPPVDGLAAHVLGRTGEITAEQLESLGDEYVVGDVVGQTGLEAAFERELAGRPAGQVRIEDAAGTVVEVLQEFPGEAPAPVTTTLDTVVQNTADKALADVAQPAAMVVLRHDGTVAAVASRPLSEDFNRALGGSYPPGSTFKVVTAAALLANGTTPETPLTCDTTINVGGRNFRNFEGDASGSVPFEEAFVQSCNTAIIGAATGLPDGALTTAAETFGFNADYTVGLTTLGGSFPEAGDEVEEAASAIGQGRVEASPVHLASMAAAVASGRWAPPVLLPDLSPPDPSLARDLDPAAAATLLTFMEAVVDRGTGTAAQVAGITVAGKTGTAEFGEGDPPPTHALFIGFDERFAVAVVVEG